MATTRIPEQKVILCGEYGVGKSSIFRRFANNTFVTRSDRQSTLGLDHYDKIYKVENKNIKLQLWDTGGMERVASITSSYYKFAEAAILVFSLDNPASFHVLSQHLLDIVTYAENAKIFLCGNKEDLVNNVSQVSESEIESFCEQCHNLINTTYKTSCKTGVGIDEMFEDIAYQLVQSNRSRIELQSMDSSSFKIVGPAENFDDDSCLC
ncbi:PREDICTED: GTP-binding protein ypt1 [Nicrophorus vespilloides]|uniref:GTP-binding protein ypt1 n=1 Tax=Nicrophorus vespilloides TaxID=110193 RepID=A0ABM1N301_NICVS|nr:PREDICTED: GTP-binding protein ypt1 [Nicrophorus vespilloides]